MAQNNNQQELGLEEVRILFGIKASFDRFYSLFDSMIKLHLLKIDNIRPVSKSLHLKLEDGWAGKISAMDDDHMLTFLMLASISKHYEDKRYTVHMDTKVLDPTNIVCAFECKSALGMDIRCHYSNTDPDDFKELQRAVKAEKDEFWKIMKKIVEYDPSCCKLANVNAKFQQEVCDQVGDDFLNNPSLNKPFDYLICLEILVVFGYTDICNNGDHPALGDL